ncbi:YceD family protein [Deferribacter abyssi]|uniref:YceD family protein n=1 Tax=Deferribacter abyssi TaxID=213806 RepID=UPI003C24BB66
MKVYFEQITIDGIDIDTAFEFDDFSSHIRVEKFNGKLYPIKKAYFLDGEVVFTINNECDRCAETFKKQFKERIQVEIVINKTNDDEKEEIELSEEDLSYYNILDNFIDINEIIREEVILLKPVKWLCSENCKGICPDCGVNLNKEKCKCKHVSLDPRFEILKKLKK